MKLIQTLNDIDCLKASQSAPQALIQAIEQDFHLLFEADSAWNDVRTFRPAEQDAIILLNAGDDVKCMFDDSFMDLEFVEREKNAHMTYYRIAKRNDYQFQLLYSVVGTHDQETEQWLQEQAAWQDRSDDEHV